MESPSPTDAELEVRIRQQEVVAELGQQALETDDFERLLRDAAVAVAETLDTDYCELLELLPDEDEVVLREGVGWRDGLVGTATQPAARDSQAGYTLLSAEPVVVNDLRDEERFEAPEMLTDHDVTSGVTVVVGSLEDPWGVLGAHTTDRREFTERDATFVRSVANVLAAAIGRADREQKLREREAQLERYREYTGDVLDAVDDVFYVVDERGRFRRWNESLPAVTGYSDDEIASMEPTDFVVPEDRERLESRIAEIFETGNARIETEVLTKDGERIPYEFAAARLENPEGRRVLAGVGRDVSEREERERKLARYETIVETVDDGIYVKGEDGRFTMVNDAYASLTGYDREELVGEHASIVVDEDTVERAKERIAADENDDPAVEANILTASGDRVPTEGTFGTFRTREGERREVGVVRDITERKRREEEHRRVVRALEAAREGVSLLDEDGAFSYVNDAYADTFGYEPEEMIGERWDELGIEADPEHFHDEILPSIAEEGQWTGTTTCVRSDDSTFLAEHSLTHTEDDELICVVRDVTERKERERNLRETRAQLDVATAAASVGLWTWDVREDVVTADDYLAETYGMGSDELADGAPMEAFYEPIHEDDRERTWTELERALEEGELEVEYRVRDADGDVSWVVARGEVVYDDGEPIRVNGAISDITERKERERRLEESERRYRTLAENFPNGVVGVYDEGLRYTLVEGAVLDDATNDGDDLEGQAVADVLPEDTVADLEPLFRAAVEDGETGSVTTEIGDRNWRVWATPLRDADGEIFAGLSFAQDITEQIERERQLEDLVERLEESNERLEQFAYAASHDLQEPLRMVSSYLQLLDRRYGDDLEDEAEEFLTFAVDGAERMRDMIEGLLDYSRVETRGDPFEPVELDAVLADVREDLRVKIEESGAEIALEELPRVEGDEEQLRQVFQNLLDNAIEYSGNERPRIHVAAERSAEDGRWEIAVRDEGIGIDADDEGRIFDVFQRLHAQDDHDGAGIGLALCERILERHGGEITVDSEPGEGSTFSFTLPAADDV